MGRRLLRRVGYASRLGLGCAVALVTASVVAWWRHIIVICRHIRLHLLHLLLHLHTLIELVSFLAGNDD